MDIMGKLLASQKNKSFNIFRGQEIEGEVVSKTDKEIILDLGTKSEGIISTRDISADQLSSLKVGDKLKAFVQLTENESSQVVLAFHPPIPTNSRGRGGIHWTKFITAQNQKNQLNGKILEVNKGGLIIEVEEVRGFLPNSQVGFELLSKVGEKNLDLVGQNLTVTVIEVDEGNNKLIFSQRGKVSADVLEKLKNIKVGQKVSGKVVAILPFGLVINIDGVEGLVFISDVSWEKIEDLSSQFLVGGEIEAQVLGIDEQLGRVNLSIKHLIEDPFQKLSQKYSADEIIKGEIKEVTESGVSVKLEKGVEGFLAASKMDPDQNYQVGKTITLLIDSVDTQRRRVNLAPFVTSTTGLIYK